MLMAPMGADCVSSGAFGLAFASSAPWESVAIIDDKVACSQADAFGLDPSRLWSGAVGL
jgi:hypothetical protein